MTHASLLKQECLGCQKTILLHTTIITCAVCSAMSHSECAKLAFEFNVINGTWMCYECKSNKQIRYIITRLIICCLTSMIQIA